MANRKSVSRLLQDGETLDQAVRDGVEKALQRHAREGSAVFEDTGKGVVEVSPRTLASRMRSRRGKHSA